MKRTRRTTHNPHPVSWLKILLINAQGAETYFKQIKNTVVKQLEEKPKVVAVTETHHRPNDTIPQALKNYIWIGKPSNKISRGVGFWIHNSISPMCDIIVKPEIKTHPDILWIQITTKQTVIYIAIVYSHPNDPPTHNKILNTLAHNVKQLISKGKVIITGDFNARCPDITGDKDTNAHTQLLQKFLLENEMSVLTNPAQQTSDDHYTFNGPQGFSIPDYIMIPSSQLDRYQYEVRQDLDTGSFHKPIVASLLFPKINTDSWGEKERKQHQLDYTTIPTYKKELLKHLPTVHTKQMLDSKEK